MLPGIAARKSGFSFLVLTGFVVCFVLILTCRDASAEYPQLRINSDPTTEVQNEQQICVNPVDANNLVACWRDFRLGGRRVAIGTSLDGGFTWTDVLMPTVFGANTDPVLTVDRLGTFYLSVIDHEWEVENQVLVYRSTNKGLTWDPPVTVSHYPTGDLLHDKEWIAVDRTGGARDGHLYVAWTRYYDLVVLVSRSTDQGATWSTPVPVVDPPTMGWWVVPTVLRNGDLLLAWIDASGAAHTNRYDRSTDGGVTWGADRVLTMTAMAGSEVIHGEIRVCPYTSLVVDETDGDQAGWIYCIYADRHAAGGGLQIWCRRSTDNGESWSDAVQVNDDGISMSDHFHPWVACDETGVLTATWYDRRDDPDNWAWHIYMSQSFDGGATWSPNTRVTSLPSSPSDAISRGRAAGLIGEYSGVAVSNGIVHPVWTDTRNLNQDTFTSVIATGLPGDVPVPSPRQADNRLYAVPNPFRWTTELRCTIPSPWIRSVEVFDVSGRLVQRLPINSRGTDSGRLRLDAVDRFGRSLAPGVYLVRLSQMDSNVEATTRILLQR